MEREKALNLVRQYKKHWTDGLREAIEVLIPELRESEDERIRTRLIEYFQGFLKGYEDCYKDGGSVRWEGLDVKSIIAWLEKQRDRNIKDTQKIEK